MDNLFEIVQSECTVDSLPSELKESIESKNININDVDDFGLTVLHYTSEMGNLEMLKYLISNSADSSILSTEGSSSPLHHAAKEGHVDVLSFLITEQKINPDVRDSQQCTPLHYAARNDKVTSLQQLLKLGANINAQDKFGWTPLFYATSVSRIDSVKFLIQQGADKTVQDEHNRTAKMIAEERGYTNLFSLL